MSELSHEAMVRLASASDEEQARFFEGHRQDAVLLVRKLASAAQAARPVSRFGGRPNLPARLDWPADEDGPLRFLAQIDVGSLRHQPALKGCPGTGLLMFFFNPYSTGCVVHIATEEAAATSPRDPPASLRPIDDWPYRCDMHLRDNRRWEDATRCLPGWLLEAHAVTVFPYEPPGFRRWPEELRQRYVTEYHGGRYIASQLDMSPDEVELVPRQLVRMGEDVPGRGAQERWDWPPGPGWPYAWIHIASFAGELQRHISGEFQWAKDWVGMLRHQKRWDSLREMMERRLLAFEARRDRLAYVAEVAKSWVARAQDHDPFCAPTPDDAVSFGRWAASLVEDEFPVSALYTSLAPATDLLLGYAPDVALQLMPESIVDAFLTRHAPIRRTGKKQISDIEVTRHQFLGPHKVVQAADHHFAAPHRLLAQFESDGTAAFTYGDAGILQFWISEEDWERGLLDRCIAIGESH